MSENHPETERDLIRELAGTVCRCGKRKRPRQTFCRTCYFKLSPRERQALYNHVGALGPAAKVDRMIGQARAFLEKGAAT